MDNMDKKNRTGLQSKISQIFAGVPMPRKRRPLSENPPENKNENSDLLQVPQNEVVIEPDVIEPPLPVKDENIIELSLAEEPVVEQVQGMQLKTGEKKIEPELLKSAAESPESQKPEVEFSGEEFSVVQEQKAEKPSAGKTVLSPQIREPIVEKPASFKQKLEVQNSFGTQKPPVNKITMLESGKKNGASIPKKISGKSAGKRLKPKAEASQSRQKLMIVLFIVFSVLLVLLLGKQFGVFSGSDNTGTIEPPLNSAKINKTTVSMIIDWKQPPVYPDDIQDPFRDRIPVPPVPGTQKLVVGGIIIVQGQYLATIGIEQKREGDTIGGAVIRKITESSVEFERDGVTWTQAVGE